MDVEISGQIDGITGETENLHLIKVKPVDGFWSSLTDIPTPIMEVLHCKLGALDLTRRAGVINPLLLPCPQSYKVLPYFWLLFRIMGVTAGANEGR
jgi:hypothetical protein